MCGNYSIECGAILGGRTATCGNPPQPLGETLTQVRDLECMNPPAARRFVARHRSQFPAARRIARPVCARVHRKAGKRPKAARVRADDFEGLDAEATGDDERREGLPCSDGPEALSVGSAMNGKCWSHHNLATP
jgi:hypothetical protein